MHRRFTQGHTLMIKLAMYSNLYIAFDLVPDVSCSKDCGVPSKFAQATRSSRQFPRDVTLAVMNRSQKKE